MSLLQHIIGLWEGPSLERRLRSMHPEFRSSARWWLLGREWAAQASRLMLVGLGGFVAEYQSALLGAAAMSVVVALHYSYRSVRVAREDRDALVRLALERTRRDCE